MPDPQLDAVVRPIGPSEVRSRVFPTTRRGLDPESVRRFVEEVATALQASLEREGELARRLDDAERRAAEPELDEDTLTAAVGAETAKVLRAAHDAAREVVARAESRAAEMLAQAGSVLTERRREAEQEASRIRERARAEAGALTEATTSQCRSMVEEAREARRRILADLAERRRTLHVQLEQLRAGKDALASVVEETAKAVEEVRVRLASSEETARAAADSAGYVAGFERDLESLESLVGEAGELLDVERVTEANSASGSDDPATDEPATDEPATDDSGELDEGHDRHEGGIVSGTDSSDAVDDLFARLRAATSVESTKVLDRGSAEDGADAPRAGLVAPPQVLAEEAPAGKLALATEMRVAEGADLDISAMLARREELLGPVIADLARIVKRELRSEQNELLDSLRSRRGVAGGLPLGPGDESAERLATATTSALVGAWRSGVTFCAGVGAGDARVEPGAEPATVAAELAEEVVTSLRRRLDEAMVAGSNEDASAELVGAAYRQWRGDRVEVLVADHVTKAFSLGVLACLGEEANVSWSVDDGEVHCPDCDDNVLAGPQRAREPFPTGQSYPPAHSGCRCMLVPTGS